MAELPLQPGNAPPDCTGDPKNPELARRIVLAEGESIAASYYVRRLRVEFSVALFLLLFLAGVLPGLLYVLWHVLRKRAHGILAVTDRRMVYLEFGKGAFGRHWQCSSFGLHTITGVSIYSQDGVLKLLGLFTLKKRKSFHVHVQSRYPVAFQVGATTASGPNPYEPATQAVDAAQAVGSRVNELQRLLLRGSMGASHG